MSKHDIEIEGLPEGYRAVAFRKPKIGDSFITMDGFLQENATCDRDHSRLIVEKIQPRRIVLEETEEVRQANTGEWWMSSDGHVLYHNYHDCPTSLDYKIWREVKEGE